MIYLGSNVQLRVMLSTGYVGKREDGDELMTKTGSNDVLFGPR